ncbi:MAG: aspartate carbamoyltransferase catalytic subunit [Candidatus Caenarcaniphilales bacterium]|nr:aspartate carbamoyltransferase catalytic subunit [Candidatus Caenarcaniphilales bacterium]
MAPNHLISCQDLSVEWVEDLFGLVDRLRPEDKPLKDIKIATLFYEDSTRTRVSFELAASTLGAEVVSLNPRLMSLNKGESFLDTARTLEALGVKSIIIRHPDSGAIDRLAESLEKAASGLTLINAGDGMREHPSQALLDLYTLKEALDDLQGKQILIVGDCLHSRVAKSNIDLLKKFGAQITLSGPPTLIPYCFERFGVNVNHNLDQALREKDVIILLRLQQERQHKGLIASLRDYSRGYLVSHERIIKARLDLGDLKIMHPGPVNPGVELESSLVDHPKASLILRQVKNGLKVRMGILAKLLC